MEIHIAQFAVNIAEWPEKIITPRRAKDHIGLAIFFPDFGMRKTKCNV